MSDQALAIEATTLRVKHLAEEIEATIADLEELIVAETGLSLDELRERNAIVSQCAVARLVAIGALAEKGRHAGLRRATRLLEQIYQLATEGAR